MIASTAVSPDAERRRLAAVRRYAVLDTLPDGTFDRVTSLASRIFDTPIATVSIVDERRVWFKAARGLPQGLRQTTREPGLCATAILHEGAYVVNDTLADPHAAVHPLVTGEPEARFYAAASITTSDGQCLGTVNVLDVRPRQVTDEQLAALEDLAALVMDELEQRLAAVRTLTTERRLRTDAERLARTLQRTLLPPALPKVPGLQAAAAYHTASVYEVGGDFYDLFPLNDGRWGFFLGDVCGKGADAAAVTSLVRYTLRAAAVYDPDPLAVLVNLDTVMQQETQDHNARYCTAVFGLLQPDGDDFVLTLADGGHPPPLAVRRDGAIEPIHAPGGQLIGILPKPNFVQSTARLHPGDTLLLYTDGLTEARTSTGSMLGEEGLTAHLAAHLPAARPGAHGILAAVHELIDGLGGGVSDDTALLALSVADRPIHPSAEEAR
ncbi:PP2C family protein-serine/threonine phosphatase [Thermomonospora echinospora]|nr:GAF domain-containing SpoIIE family protein phosphatase [Thermomonospora echinospora]